MLELTAPIAPPLCDALFESNTQAVAITLE
jgi:hypothetical protein